MIQFHETGYGRRFFEHDLPELIKQLSRIADCMEKRQVIAEQKDIELNWEAVGKIADEWFDSLNNFELIKKITDIDLYEYDSTVNIPEDEEASVTSREEAWDMATDKWNTFSAAEKFIFQTQNM